MDINNYFLGKDRKRKFTKVKDGQPILELIQLGAYTNNEIKLEKGETYSKLVKYRVVTKQDYATENCYSVAVVLRENGSFEVYSDFMLVHVEKLKKRPCVDIETNFHNFFFKFVVEEKLESLMTAE